MNANNGGIARRVFIGFLFFFLALPATAGRAAAASPTPKLRAVYNAPSGAMSPLWVGDVAGLFQKNGVDVEVKYIASTSSVQAMVGGSEDVGLVGNQGIDADLEGARTIYLATTLPVFVFHLYARPDIRTVRELKGKVVVASQRASSTDYAMRIVLRRFGLIPDRDVRIFYAGSMPGLLSAVSSGNASAGLMSAPTTLKARAAGLKEILNVTKLKIPFLFVGVLTTDKVLRERGEALTRFLKGYLESIAVIRRDKKTTLKAMAKYLKTNNARVLDAVYEEYYDVFPKVPLMTTAQVQAVLDVSSSPRARQMKPRDFYDNSLLEKIEGSGFIDSLYSH